MENKISKKGTKNLIDRKELILELREGAYEDWYHCSLLTEKVLINCNFCNLKGICDSVDKLSDDISRDNVVIVDTFKF